MKAGKEQAIVYVPAKKRGSDKDSVQIKIKGSGSLRLKVILSPGYIDVMKIIWIGVIIGS